MITRRAEHDYLIMDTADTPLGKGKRVSPPNSPELQVLVLDGMIDEVEGRREIKLLSMDGSPPKICTVLRSRGDRVVLKAQDAVATDMRRNLRVPVCFDSLLYPISGRWRGCRAARSIDLSCGGVAFYGDDGLEVEEKLELVIPVTEQPVILRCQILRKQELRNGKLLYAVKFVDMCEDEEVTVREAVFSIQLENRPHAAGDDDREEQR